MSPSRLIIDLNRCFEPNPFNTGPPIPTPRWNAPDASIDASTLIQEYGSSVVPDLTASPSSSCGSSVHSLSLEDEDIKRIFAAQIQSPRKDVSQNLDHIYAPIEVDYFTCREELNPHAAPFIPSSERSSPPAKLVGIDLAFQPSPLNLGFEPINFATPAVAVQDQSPGTQYSPHHDCIPLPPRSASLYHLGLAELDEREVPIAIEAPLQSSPVYLPLFTEAFHPNTSNRLRKVLAHAIVNVCPTNWDLETLLDLAKRISVEACRSVVDNEGKTEPSVSACDSSQSKLGESGTRCEDVRKDSSSRPEIVVADMSLSLYEHFASAGEEMGQAFGWNLRESILRRFISYWDSASQSAINFENKPTVHDVRSALAICKSIGALFTRNLIAHQHISMCISILMKDLMSVEHLQALANLVLSAGPTFWKATNTETTEVEVTADPGVLPLDDDSLLFSTKSGPGVTRVHQNSHVLHFMSGLSANIFHKNLRGQESVVNMGWTRGQFAARVVELVDTVYHWESIMNSHTQTSGLSSSISSLCA